MAIDDQQAQLDESVDLLNQASQVQQQNARSRNQSNLGKTGNVAQTINKKK